MSLINTLAQWMKKGRRNGALSGNHTFEDRVPSPSLESASRSNSAASSSFPRFRATAGDQLGSLAESTYARTRMKLLESFTPAQPVSDRRRFAGRLDVLTAIIRAIEEQRLHVVVYGERGLGKTSVMHVLTQAARDARYLVVYVSCGADSNFDEVFRTVAAHIPMLFHGAVGPTSPDVEKGKTLADTLPKVPISPRVASDLLAKIVGTRVVVVLDEFDRSASEEFRQNVAELMKNLSDRLVRVQLVIAGVAGNLNELLEHIPSIQRNIFALQVPWMSAAEIHQLIHNGGTLAGLTFEKDAQDAIVFTAHGSPYLATLLGHHAGLSALDKMRSRVNRSDVLASIGNALLEFQGRLPARVRPLIKTYVDQQKMPYLGIVAGASLLSNGAFRKADLLESTVSSNLTELLENVLEELIKAELLVETTIKDTRLYRFSEDGIAPYLWLLSREAALLDAAAQHPPATPRLKFSQEKIQS